MYDSNQNYSTKVNHGMMIPLNGVCKMVALSLWVSFFNYWHPSNWKHLGVDK